jgi:hypothetical protein
MRAGAARQNDVVKLLLDMGANPNALDKKGRNALHYAIPEGEAKPKKKRGFGGMLGGLAKGALGGAIGGKLGDIAGGSLASSLLGSTSLDGLLAATCKVCWGDLVRPGRQRRLDGDCRSRAARRRGRQIQYRLASGRRSSNLDAGKWTSLLSSVKGGKPEILQAMTRLGNGAAPETVANWTQFLTSASSGDVTGAAALMNKPELAGLLQQATNGLKAGAGELPGNASRSIISALIERGAKADASNKDGDTPAKLAQERGLSELAALLGGAARVRTLPFQQPQRTAKKSS